MFKLPYCSSNEGDVKRFIDKIKSFTNGKLKFIVLWSTRNIKSLFPLKDRVKHLSCVIFERKCSCGRRYIGETIRNSDIRWNEHVNHPQQVNQNLPNTLLITNHVCLLGKSLHFRKRKILEVFFVTKLKPDLNDQIEQHALLLFRHAVT